MNINWYSITQIFIIGLFWGCFFHFGWFQTIIWTIIIASIIGIILRLRSGYF